MPNQPRTPHRTIRIADDVWNPAKTRAAARNETLSDVIRRALTDYLEEPVTITLDDLAAEFAGRYGLERTAAREEVDALAAQVADDPNLYDEANNTVTEAGAEVIRDQMAADHS